MGQTKFYASRAAKHKRQCSESHCYSGLNLSPEKRSEFRLWDPECCPSLFS